MARAKNAACPKCQCEIIRKERMFGSQTGDYVCGECGYTSTPPEFEHEYQALQSNTED